MITKLNPSVLDGFDSAQNGDILVKNGDSLQFQHIGIPSQGEQGVQGVQGLQGLQGRQGVQGVQGLKGDQGIQGVQGLKGDQGVQGVQGLKGDQGVQGVQGLQGLQGRQGVQGVQGLKGDQGVQGLQGRQGVQGVQGLKGDQGIQGVQGLQGTAGEQGVQGVQGLQGTAGEQGVQGPAGSGGLSNYDLTFFTLTTDTTNISFEANQQCYKRLTMTAGATLNFSVLNKGCNYLRIYNSSASDITIAIGAITYNNTAVTTKIVPDEAITVCAGKYVEIGITADASEADITVSGNLKVL